MYNSQLSLKKSSALVVLFWLAPLLVLALAMFLVVLVHDFDYLPFEGVTLKEIVVRSSHSGQLLAGDLHLLVYVVQVNGGVPGGASRLGVCGGIPPFPPSGLWLGLVAVPLTVLAACPPDTHCQDPGQGVGAGGPVPPLSCGQSSPLLSLLSLPLLLLVLELLQGMVHLQLLLHLSLENQFLPPGLLSGGGQGGAS